MKWQRFEKPSDGSSDRWGYHGVPYRGAPNRFLVVSDGGGVDVLELIGIGDSAQSRLISQFRAFENEARAIRRGKEYAEQWGDVPKWEKHRPR